MKIKYTHIVYTSDGFLKLYECHDDSQISYTSVIRAFFLESKNGKLQQISEDEATEAMSISIDIIKKNI